MKYKSQITSSLEILQENLESTTQVSEWARLAGFKCPKKFSRYFQRHYSMRPLTYLKYVRLINIIKDLRSSNAANFEVARRYGICDEIALNKFINYHLGCSPSELKCMHQGKLDAKLEKIGSKVR